MKKGMEAKNESAAECCPADISRCDTFEFMANVIGLPILHPGGLRANDEMIRFCGIAPGDGILDVACGKGTNACYFAEKTGCSVTGIDLDERLIRESQRRAERRGLSDRIRFQTANAAQIPFPENTFDVVLFQAVLIMVGDPEKVLREAERVLRPGGRIGILELTWKKQPPKDFFLEAENICAYFQNVKTFEDWRRMIFGNHLKEANSQLYPMACPCSLKELGLVRAARIFLKQAVNAKIRRRMRQLDGFVSGHDDYFGYGIYIGRKTV